MCSAKTQRGKTRGSIAPRPRSAAIIWPRYESIVSVRTARLTRDRNVGFARIFVADRSAIVAVAFAEPGDMVLLGAMGLETLNLRIDPGRKELVPAGPLPVAAAAPIAA